MRVVDSITIDILKERVDCAKKALFEALRNYELELAEELGLHKGDNISRMYSHSYFAKATFEKFSVDPDTLEVYVHTHNPDSVEKFTEEMRLNLRHN